MRREWILGFGLAGVLSGPAVAQFASDRMPMTPTQPPQSAPFGGAQSTGVPPATAQTTVPGYVPPVGGFQPATGGTSTGGFQPAGGTQPPLVPNPEDIPSALGLNHPLLVRPEHGAYFLCVKSYSRPSQQDPRNPDPGMTARELAEGLVAEIRQAHRVNVYLYEYISEEKKAQAIAKAAARQRAQAFSASLEQYRQRGGGDFLEPDHKLRYQTFRFRDQIAVLVGGFKTEDDAVRAMAEVKKWAPPRDNRLMDGGALSNSSADGKGGVIERTYFNPFATAMVVPNPTIPKVAQGPVPKVDPFLVRLNEGKPYNLLKAPGTWTLGVKSFTAPIILQTKDDNPGPFRKFGFGGMGADPLTAGAGQAESLAKALRAMKGPNQESLHLEAFVLHTRTASIVTVGSFDSPNDPALAATHRLLSNLNFHVRDHTGTQPVANMGSVFERDILPIPIPKP